MGNKLNKGRVKRGIREEGESLETLQQGAGSDAEEVEECARRGGERERKRKMEVWGFMT